MFEFIGKKIKVLAKVMFWMGLIGNALCSLIGVIVFVADGEPMSAVAILLLSLVSALLSVAFWWFVYGLGQLIDNSDKLVALKQRELEHNGITNDYVTPEYINNSIYKFLFILFLTSI